MPMKLTVPLALFMAVYAYEELEGPEGSESPRV